MKVLIIGVNINRSTVSTVHSMDFKMIIIIFLILNKGQNI